MTSPPQSATAAHRRRDARTFEHAAWPEVPGFDAIDAARRRAANRHASMACLARLHAPRDRRDPAQPV